MRDVSGSRFLRMAGSGDFQNRLNRSAQPTGTKESSITGDFTGDAIEGSQTDSQGKYTANSAGSRDSHYKWESPRYSATSSGDDVNTLPIPGSQHWFEKPSSIMGPGSFGKQIYREKYLEDNDIAQGNDFNDSFVAKYSQMNKENQQHSNDGASIANKYIRNAASSNPIDLVALDKHIRSSPLYDEAKSKLEGMRTYGDHARWSKEMLPAWTMPNPMEEVEKPDFGAIYDKTKNDIDDIDI